MKGTSENLQKKIMKICFFTYNRYTSYIGHMYKCLSLHLLPIQNIRISKTPPIEWSLLKMGPICGEKNQFTSSQEVELNGWLNLDSCDRRATDVLNQFAC